MNLDRYGYEKKQTYKEYFFYSEGPNGRILKIVRFILVNAYPRSYYYLALGDWDEGIGEPDYLSVTNNRDTEKVLATVAAIVLDFTNISRNAIIYAEGSDLARTRRYQIGINKYWHEIEKIFYVYGHIGEEMHSFQKNVNYKGFLIFRKEYINLEEQNDAYMTSSHKKNEERKYTYNDRIIDGPALINENSPAIRRKVEESRKFMERCTNLDEILKKHNLL